jgi:hypothetical protein
MVVAADVVELLGKRRQYVLTESLLRDFLKRDSRRTPEMFTNSVAFLYAFDLIEQDGYRLRLCSKSSRPHQLALEMPGDA